MRRKRRHTECQNPVDIFSRIQDARKTGISGDGHTRQKGNNRQVLRQDIRIAIYGLSEYCRATGDTEALEYAAKLYHDIEDHSFDRERNGYLEAFAEDWSPLQDMRLSEKDINECKTMNTHLHILEPYTALYRVWKDEGLRERLENLIRLFTEKIMSPETGHLRLFFDENWVSSHDIISYGHDIEASWLIHEAVSVLEDPELLSMTAPAIKAIAEAASEGYVPGGGMIYEFHGDT